LSARRFYFERTLSSQVPCQSPHCDKTALSMGCA
jgi:hypothetical protein